MIETADAVISMICEVECMQNSNKRNDSATPLQSAQRLRANGGGEFIGSNCQTV